MLLSMKIISLYRNSLKCEKKEWWQHWLQTVSGKWIYLHMTKICLTFLCFIKRSSIKLKILVLNFFPSQLILKNVDSLLYVDTDILFLRPVDDIWSFLGKFNSTQIAAMAPEHEEPRIGWYNRFARHPYYGVTGINSGVMLMNMTRIRRKYFKVCVVPQLHFWWISIF